MREAFGKPLMANQYIQSRWPNSSQTSTSCMASCTTRLSATWLAKTSRVRQRWPLQSGRLEPQGGRRVRAVPWRHGLCRGSVGGPILPRLPPRQYRWRSRRGNAAHHLDARGHGQAMSEAATCAVDGGNRDDHPESSRGAQPPRCAGHGRRGCPPGDVCRRPSSAGRGSDGLRLDVLRRGGSGRGGSRRCSRLRGVWSGRDGRAPHRAARSPLGRRSPRCKGMWRGGGNGLVAACDLAIASEDALFAFSEVRLGVAPAVISVVCLMVMHRRAAQGVPFLTGEWVDRRSRPACGTAHVSGPGRRTGCGGGAMRAC